jgi:transposase
VSEEINEKIRGLVQAGGHSQREIAAQLGVSRGSVYRVCAGLKVAAAA